MADKTVKIVTVVGTRPQFIKAAEGSRQLRKKYQEILVHTGQHYDDNMSGVFFREIGLSNPDYHLGISGGSHARMTAEIMTGVEQVFLNERPDAVLVYGDTDSTLAAALAASKLRIPVLHVEAGNRMGTLNNPEEINRITTDHISTINFCATEACRDQLRKEGLGDRSFFIGNIMYDSFLRYANLPWNNPQICGLNGEKIHVPDEFYYMTCHRQENTYDDHPLTEMLFAMNSLDSVTVFPVHPRNRERAKRIVEKAGLKRIILAQPVGYIDSVHLIGKAKKIVTDSGGLQCEAFFAGTQCIFVFDHVLWPETMVDNRNQLAKAERNDILNKLSEKQKIDPLYQPFGDGHAAEKVVEIMEKYEVELNRD